jgi:hypothetical protein
MFSTYHYQDTIKPPYNPTAEKITAARIYARSLAESVPLKAPATATYARPSVSVDPKHPDRFTVASYVDSQNGFGAMIRTYWSIDLRYLGSDAADDINKDANWNVEQFKFDGEKIM